MSEIKPVQFNPSDIRIVLEALALNP